MRAFFLFLLLLNLIYFAIRDFLMSASSSAAPAVTTALPGGVQPLRILETASAATGSLAPQTEAAAAATPPAQAASVRVAASVPVAHCYSLGPFGAKASAEAMVAAFGKREVTATLRTIRQMQVTGYWIYLPPYPSVAAAAAETRRLDAMGYHHYYIVDREPYTNAISLGLFHEHSGAERRLARVRKLGVQPKLQVRTAVKALYWLDYRDPGGGAINSSLWANANADSGTLQRVKRSCSPG